MPGRAAVLHAVLRRADRGAPLPGQGRHPVRPGRRHRRHGAHRAGRRPPQADRLRHGRHQHRCVALCRRVRARLRDAGGRRAHARADDEHPHRGRRRRLDPRLRRRAAARRARKAPAPTPARPATGAAGRWPPPMPTCCWAASSRRTFRMSSGPPATSRWTARACAAQFEPLAAQVQQASGRPTTRRVAGRRLPAHRRAGHGQCHQAHLGGARLRRHRLHAAVLRRRRRPACLRRGRCAGHDAHLRAPAGGRAVGLRHGPGRPDRDARGLGRAAARRRGPGRGARSAWPSWAAPPRDELVGAGRAGAGRGTARDAAPALPGHRHRAGRAAGRRWTARARPSRPPTASASPS